MELRSQNLKDLSLLRLKRSKMTILLLSIGMEVSYESAHLSIKKTHILLMILDATAEHQEISYLGIRRDTGTNQVEQKKIQYHQYEVEEV